ncbi:MAG: apolipoprotein N-acyltransferase, partial [Spirochaetota bacterium]|nr:apolipoprotein N-acyltransferase [Spirochaetota bacterium]
MSKILQVFYALFSAILLSLAIQNEFLPWGSPFLGLFALVPLYIAFSRAKTARESGFLFSLTVSVTHLLSSFWLSNFKDFALFTIGATTIWYTISCFFLGQLFYGVFFIPPSKKLIIDSGKNPWHIPRRVFLFVSLYILFEWQKSTGFLAYPWGTLYMASYKWQIFSQIAA